MDFDANGNGIMDKNEFANLIRATSQRLQQQGR